MEVRPFVDEKVEPVGMLRVETEKSIWFVTAERYQRLPREERPRRSQLSIARGSTMAGGMASVVAGGECIATVTASYAFCLT